MTAIFSALGAIFLCALGLIKFFNRKNREKRERITQADQLHKEGMAERDPSKITAANSRLNNDV